MDDLRPLRAHPALPFAIPFTTAQALDRGVTGNQLGRLVRQGHLQRLVQGVYVDAAVELTPRLRVRALGLVVPETAVVTDETAAWARGIDLFATADRVIPPPLSVVQPLDRTRVRKEGVDGRRRLLAPRDIEIVDGVAMTTLLRTGIDIARKRPRSRGLGALDATSRAGDFTSEDVLAELDRFRGFRGVVRLRELAPLTDPRAESLAESAMRLLWTDAGLRRPVLQIPILTSTGHVMYRLDMGLPEIRYAAEYDGIEWHSSPEQRERDRARRAWLRTHQGWTIDVLGRNEVFRNPDLAPQIFRAGIARAERRFRRTA